MSSQPSAISPQENREWRDGRPFGCAQGRPRPSVWGWGPAPSRPNQVGQALLRWLKFNLVGGIGIGVQLAVLTILKSVLHFDYLLATALAVETAVIHNFLWHERFTWADRPARHLTHSLSRLAKFNLSNGLVSLVGNLVIMRALVGGFRMNYVVANLIAVVTCSLVNFLLGDRFVFES